jgi:DNA-binding winged helix-turn-helix (wHTH) protein/tetratricopeptide (TPR) repeat protein
MQPPENDVFRFDEFEFDPSRRLLTRNGVPVSLLPKPFEILAFLVLNPGRVVSKEELIRAVWPDSFVEESNLPQQISALRKALAGKSSLVATVPGRGYQFIAKVQAEHAVEALPERMPGDIFVQRVRERTSVVIEKPAPGPAPLALSAGPPARRWKTGLWMGILLLAGAVIAVVATQEWRRLTHPPQLCKVMVADFANSTGDGTFDRTLKRALEIDLGQSPYIDVMSDRETLSTLQSMGRSDGAAITSEVAREICERGNRQVLLTGNIAPFGHEYLLTLEATDCTSGKKLAGAKAEAATKEKVLAALDWVADHLRKGLGESTESLESYQVPIQNATTGSLEALKAYSIGQYLGAQGKTETETLPFYQKAAELDPRFAMAYGAIASDYYNLNEFSLAAQYYKKAFDLSDSVSAKEKLDLQAHYYCEGRQDVLEGIKAYQLWAATYPHDFIPWVNLTNEYTQLGNYAPAIVTGKRAVEEAPGRGISYSVLARALKCANRFAEAKSVGQLAVARGKDSYGLHGTLFEIAFAENDPNALAREIDWSKKYNGAGWFLADLQASAASATGEYKKAADLYRSAMETAEQDKLPETEGDILLDQAQAEWELGLRALARATLSRVRYSDPNSPDLAILQAELGDASAAEHFLSEHASDPHPGTRMEFVDLPRVRATLAIEGGKPLDAVAALEPARPYELSHFNVLSQRAAACLQAGLPDQAADAYRKIIANQGVDPLSALYPLAHLGLARADAARNDKIGSRAEYEKFFELWKNADAGLPILKQARQEYSRLP